MKKYSYLLSLFLLFALHLDAQSLLYKVSSKSSTVYILGSIHLAKPELYPLDKAIINAYGRSDALVLELDPSSATSQQTIQHAMMGAGFYPPGKNLKNQLSEKTFSALQAYTQKANLPLQNFMQMRPWAVMLQLSVMEMMRLGYSPELGIDQHFLLRAKADGKEIIELESAQEQMDLLSKNDKNFQDQMLFYTLESMDEVEPMLDKMFTYWEEGNAKAFDAIMSKPLQEDPSLKGIYDDLITKRNYTMTQKIQDFLTTKTDYFVVVGAGHVIGEEGIVSLLEKQGYSVTQH